MKIADAKYNEWLTPERLCLLKSWRDAGITDMEFAARMGICMATFYAWKHKYPEFAAATNPNIPKHLAWLTLDGLSQLSLWRAEGLADKQIAARIGITRDTLRRWKLRFPAIDAALRLKPTHAERWLTPEKLRLLKSWKAEGLTDEAIAARMGINRRTFSQWKKDHPELAEAAKPIPPKYRKWLAPEGLGQMRCWKGAGLSDCAIAQNMGISRRSLAQWKTDYPPLAAALEEKPLLPEEYILENAFFQSALNRVVTEYTETTDPDGSISKVERTRHIPGSTNAQIVWLRNRKKDPWRKQ